MNKIIKAGIIGCGNIATYIDDDIKRPEIWGHTKAYQIHPKTRLISACDNDLEKLSKFCDNTRQSNPIIKYQNYVEMIRKEDLDIVSICTPTDTHESIISDLIDLNIMAIFCEKPFTHSASSAKKITEKCRNKSIVIAVNYMRRWDPVIKKVKDMLNNGEIGKLQTITAHTGTALFMSASHLLDTILFLGGKIKTVYGKLQYDFVRKVNGQQDFGGHAYFEMMNDISGFVKATAISEDHLPFELDLIGTMGRLRIHNYAKEIELSKFSTHQFMSRYKNWHTSSVNYEKNERMLNAIDDIIDCVKLKREPVSSASTATKTNQFIEAIYESDRNNAPVYLTY